MSRWRKSGWRRARNSAVISGLTDGSAFAGALTGAQFPSPLVGEDRDSAEGRARRGAPGIGLPVEAGPPRISRRGKAHAIRQARPLRLTDLSPSSLRCSMPGDPLLARPSAESVLPTRGRRSGAHLPPPRSRSEWRGGPTGRGPEPGGGCFPEALRRRSSAVSMAALAQPPHILVALSPGPTTPHPYPSPPLGFAERGEGGATPPARFGHDQRRRLQGDGRRQLPRSLHVRGSRRKFLPPPRLAEHPLR